MAVIVDGTGTDAMGGSVVLDRDPARDIVTVVSMGDDRRSPDRSHRQHRRRGDCRGPRTKPLQH
jgi:hypothetical protein